MHSPNNWHKCMENIVHQKILLEVLTTISHLINMISNFSLEVKLNCCCGIVGGVRAVFSNWSLVFNLCQLKLMVAKFFNRLYQDNRWILPCQSRLQVNQKFLKNTCWQLLTAKKPAWTHHTDVEMMELHFHPTDMSIKWIHSEVHFTMILWCQYPCHPGKKYLQAENITARNSNFLCYGDNVWWKPILTSLFLQQTPWKMFVLHRVNLYWNYLSPEMQLRCSSRSVVSIFSACDLHLESDKGWKYPQGLNSHIVWDQAWGQAWNVFLVLNWYFCCDSVSMDQKWSTHHEIAKLESTWKVCSTSLIFPAWNTTRFNSIFSASPSTVGAASTFVRVTFLNAL